MKRFSGLVIVVSAFIISSVVCGCGAQPQTAISVTDRHVVVPDIKDTVTAEQGSTGSQAEYDFAAQLFEQMSDSIEYVGTSVVTDTLGRTTVTKVKFKPKGTVKNGKAAPVFFIDTDNADVAVRDTDTTVYVVKASEKPGLADTVKGFAIGLGVLAFAGVLVWFLVKVFK